ncbi:unnamed protein product [Closterium sp. Naga37s-1]|nr:unnamed protein product [Closterium sp. Naga37s-1]
MPPTAAICFPLPLPRTPGAAFPRALLPTTDSKSDRSLYVSHFDVTRKPTYHPAPHSACALCFGGGNPRRAKEPRPRRSAHNGGVRQGTLGVRPEGRRIPLARGAAGDEGGAARAQVEGAGGAAEASDARVARVMRVLREDLPVQYERDLDWSIYDASVAFVDPVSSMFAAPKERLQHGPRSRAHNFQTSRRSFPSPLTLFTPPPPLLPLSSPSPPPPLSCSPLQIPPDALTCSPFSPRAGLEGRVGEAVCAVRSVWSTRGQTRWGKTLSITGDDVFRVNSTGKIITHESAWNESPSQVWEAFRL